MNPLSVLEHINQQRLETGLLGLVWNETLAQAAKNKNQDMIQNGYFSHLSTSGENITAFVDESYHYHLLGENLAFGFDSEDLLTKAWMKSEKHKANILDDEYLDTGIAVSKANQKYLVTQVFGLKQKDYWKLKSQYMGASLSEQLIPMSIKGIFVLSTSLFILLLGYLLIRKLRQ